MAEWREREEEIRRLQEARLEILKRVIERREKENEEVNRERVRRVWERRLAEREAGLEKLERKKVKGKRMTPRMTFFVYTPTIFQLFSKTFNLFILCRFFFYFAHKKPFAN